MTKRYIAVSRPSLAWATAIVFGVHRHFERVSETEQKKKKTNPIWWLITSPFRLVGWFFGFAVRIYYASVYWHKEKIYFDTQDVKVVVRNFDEPESFWESIMTWTGIGGRVLFDVKSMVADKADTFNPKTVFLRAWTRYQISSSQGASLPWITIGGDPDEVEEAIKKLTKQYSEANVLKGRRKRIHEAARDMIDIEVEAAIIRAEFK